MQIGLAGNSSDLPPPSLLPVVSLESKRFILRLVNGPGGGEIGGGKGGSVRFLLSVMSVLT